MQAREHLNSLMATKPLIEHFRSRRSQSIIWMFAFLLEFSNVNVGESNTGGSICRSVDIRNTIDQFEVLRGCTVVEGFVNILLFDDIDESLFENVTFPELTEITDYLLFYRVNGLRSIGQLFPNLAVIRGQNIFFGYAFVVFEMPSLQEIGLYSLTDIVQGGIRIDRNPSLCFVNTIDWDQITHEKGDHFIKSTKPDNECPLCPGDVPNNEVYLNIPACPLDQRKRGEITSRSRHLCWNVQRCQKICPNGCSTCNEQGECCDSKCLGGCTNDVCAVCRNFISFDKQCRDHCPSGLYEYLGRRCITKEECTGLKKPLEISKNRIQPEYPYKIFKNSCILQCPSNYTDDFLNHQCVPDEAILYYE